MNLLEAKKVLRDAGYKLMKEEWTYTPEIEDKLVASGAAKYPEELEDDGEEASWLAHFRGPRRQDQSFPGSGGRFHSLDFPIHPLRRLQKGKSAILHKSR